MFSNGHGRKTRLVSVFSQLPGSTHGGLAGMTERMNSVKAYFFNPNAIWGLNSRSTCDAIGHLKLAGIVMDMLHSSEIRQLFVDANTRIYQAFLDVDGTPNSGGECPGRSRDHLSATWASDYQKWLINFLADREAEIRHWATWTQKDISTQIYRNVTMMGADGQRTRMLDPRYEYDRAYFAAFTASPYADPGFWSFNFNLEWPLPVARKLKARDGSPCSPKAESMHVPSEATPQVLPTAGVQSS